MTSTRRRAALGAIGATVLLFAATACASESDDSADASPAPSAAPADTAADTTEAPAPADGTTGTTTPSDTTTEATTAPESSDAPTPTEAPVVVPEALQFTAPLVGGGTFDGAAVAGKPTVFWFWAPT